jgi:hypothetical protein
MVSIRLKPVAIAALKQAGKTWGSMGKAVEALLGVGDPPKNER